MRDRLDGGKWGFMDLGKGMDFGDCGWRRGEEAKRGEKFGEWLAKGMDDSAKCGLMMIRSAAETF